MAPGSTRWRPSAVVSPYELFLATLAGIAGLAGSYAVAGFSREFLVAPIDALVVRLTPGGIVAFMIQNVGESAHLLHVGLSVVIGIGLLGAAALVGLALARRRQPEAGVLVAGAVAWAISAVVTGEPVLAIATAVPVATVTAIGTLGRVTGDPDPSRRRAILSGATAIAALVGGLGLQELATGEEPEETAPAPIDDDVAGLMADAEDKSLDIAGDVPGLVSSFEEFYNVDIAQFDPDLTAEDWTLTLTGEVTEDLTVTFEDLTAMSTEHRFVTLRCVGESLNGDKLDTAVWTGTPIAPLLEAVDPEGTCGCAMLRAEDGYFVQFPIEALEDGFLAWRMNGQALPQSHGHPVRVLIPGHWGETNVKWLSEIEVLDEEMDGYWEQRGWHGTGPVNTVAKLWSDTVLENGNVEVAGHAYAGTRGVERVEVSIDGGSTWDPAELSEPLPGDDVWRQWRYEYPPDGNHEVVVRAIDGEGTVQPQERSRSFPSGATGWVNTRVRV